MDPFVIFSFDMKVFRTRVIRCSLNPVRDEKLLFHMRKYDRSYRVQLTVLDWDKLSSNDHVGDAAILTENVPAPRGCILTMKTARARSRSSNSRLLLPKKCRGP